MDRQTIVRNPRTFGCAGGVPTTPLGEGGESPSFLLHLSEPQITAMCIFRMDHGFFSDSDPACTEIHPVPTWSADLSTIEELTLSCSCGAERTFDRFGKEVNSQ